MKLTFFELLGITLAAVLIVGGFFYYFQNRPRYSDTLPLTIAAYKGEFSSLIYIAEDRGLFERYGLDVTINEYDTGVGPIQSVISGEADVSTSGEFVFTNHAYQDEELRVFGVIDIADAIEVVARTDHGISLPEDLRGKTVAVVQNSQGEYLLGKFLDLHSIALDEITVVYLSPTEIVNAMQDGSIDATVIWEPNIFKIEQSVGDNVITWSTQPAQDFFFVLSTTQDVIDANPEKLNRLLEALDAASRFENWQTGRAKNIVSEYTGFDRAYLNAVWEQNNFTVQLPNVLPLVLESEADWMLKNGLVSEVLDFHKLIYRDPCDCLVTD